MRTKPSPNDREKLLSLKDAAKYAKEEKRQGWFTLHGDACRTIVALVEALEYSNASLKNVLHSDYETPTNKEPWKQEDAWVKADTLLRQLGVSA